MNPTAGSFIINPRLQRLFMTLAMDFPGQDSLMQIYGTFLAGHFKHFKNDIQEMQTKILQVLRSQRPVSGSQLKTLCHMALWISQVRYFDATTVLSRASYAGSPGTT